MIRARTCAWHGYGHVFADLRSGRLTMSEYEVMVGEDATEASRRRAEVYDDAIDDAEETTEDTDRKPTVCQPKIGITFNPNDDYTHAIDLVDDEAVILIRNESSGAY